MTLTDLRKMTPHERLVWWICEREAIRLKKDAGELPPWTSDPILQRFRFCNVCRIEDKVSQWLLKEWYLPYKNHPNMLLAAALARFVNNPVSLTYVGFPKRWEPERIKRRLRDLRDSGVVVFNAAYMVRGNNGEDKIESVVDHNVGALRAAKIMVDTSSMENTWRAISGVYGFGSFMAGQVTADLRWALTGTWADKKTWAPLGPGSLKGINYLLGRKSNQPMKQEAFLSHLRRLIETVGTQIPWQLEARMEAQDWQSCLCESSKVHKALFGPGRPKQRYPGEGV